MGAEGKKNFIQKNPHTEISKLGFRDIVRLAKISFEKTKCITWNLRRLKNVVLQDTLTFETFSPEEVLKPAIKFEHSKQTTQAFQKSSSSTNNSGLFSNSQLKIKQEPIMAIGNKGYNSKRQSQNQNRRKQYENKNTQKTKGD